jgi:HSP20 family protein
VASSTTYPNEESLMASLPALIRSRTLSPLWRDWGLIEDRMNRLLEGFPTWEAGGEPLLLAPRVDFAEQNGKYVLTAELPGVDLKDVDIDVEGNVLSIKGEKKAESEREEGKVRIQERRYGSFERAFTLPQAADPGQVKANFGKGVLTVEIGKRPEAKGKKVKVEAK